MGYMRTAHRFSGQFNTPTGGRAISQHWRNGTEEMAGYIRKNLRKMRRTEGRVSPRHVAKVAGSIAGVWVNMEGVI